jgi:hypothetical protein
MTRTLFVSFVALLFAAHAESRGLVVSPAQLGISAKAGETATGVITVSSSRPEENQVRVTIVDFARSEDGRLQLLSGAKPPRSSKDWLTATQNSFVSPNAGSVTVGVRARVPADASGSYWAALVLSSVPPARGPRKNIGMELVPQIAIPIIVTVTGTEKRDIRLLETGARRVSDSSIEPYLVVENRGNAAVMLSGAFTIDRNEGTDVEELADTELPVTLSLPGARSRIAAKLSWTGAVDGLNVHAIVRYGPTPADIAEISGPIVDSKTSLSKASGTRQ